MTMITDRSSMVSGMLPMHAKITIENVGMSSVCRVLGLYRR